MNFLSASDGLYLAKSCSYLKSTHSEMPINNCESTGLLMSLDERIYLYLHSSEILVASLISHAGGNSLATDNILK